MSNIQDIFDQISQFYPYCDSILGMTTDILTKYKHIKIFDKYLSIMWI